MLLGLLGDVHGNPLALRAVLDAARGLGVERLLVTGDLVGYYFDPAGVLELLGAWNTQMVRGNHEDMLKETADDPAALQKYEPRYGTGLRAALETLTAPQIAQLTALPHPLSLELDSRRILLCHGSPWDNDKYLYPDAPAAELQRCMAGGHHLVVIGHTHYSMLMRFGDALLLNPGSVGQPRDRKPGAAWATFDTVTGEVELRRERYDTGPLAREAAKRHPDMPYLAEVLTRT
jgi:putative phosphoesterase